jgi:tetratricopeptide (TPR) repeat protein
MHARLNSIATLAVCALALCSCGTPEIKITYTRPPERKIPDSIKVLGIAPIEVPEGAAVEPGSGERIEGLIEDAIGQNGKYRLINRSQLKALMAERQIKVADFAEGGQKDLQLKEVQALIIGSVSKAIVEEGYGPLKAMVITVQHVPGTPFARRRPVIMEVPNGRYLTAEMSITIKMIDTTTGETYASKNFSESYDSRNAEEFKGQRLATPSEKLPAKGQMFEDLLGSCIQRFLNQICPFTVTRTVRLISRGDFSEKGIKMATRNLIEDAVAQFDLAIQNEQPNDHALYDKGVMLEILGRFDEAYAAFKQAYIIEEDDLYLDAMQRMKEEKAFVPPAEGSGS